MDKTSSTPNAKMSGFIRLQLCTRDIDAEARRHYADSAYHSE